MTVCYFVGVLCISVMFLINLLDQTYDLILLTPKKQVLR